MSLATKRCRGHVRASNPDFSYSVTKVLLNTLAGTPVKALGTTLSVSLEESKRSRYPCNAPLSRHTKKLGHFVLLGSLPDLVEVEPIISV
jgi:hypothetical protein